MTRHLRLPLTIAPRPLDAADGHSISTKPSKQGGRPALPKNRVARCGTVRSGEHVRPREGRALFARTSSYFTTREGSRSVGRQWSFDQGEPVRQAAAGSRAGSTEVHPMDECGAVQIGVHLFCEQAKSRVNQARAAPRSSFTSGTTTRAFGGSRASSATIILIPNNGQAV